MANERASWKRNDEGAWALDVVNPPFKLIPTSDGVRLRADYGFGGYLTAAEWRAMCALPVVPQEATGEASRDLAAEVERLTRELAATEAARVEAFEMARKHIVSDDPPSEEAMRYGREVVAPRLAAEATPAIADGTSQPWTPPAKTQGASPLYVDGENLPPINARPLIARLEAQVWQLTEERDAAIARAVQTDAAPPSPTFGAMVVEADQLREKVAHLEADVATQTNEVNRLSRELHEERQRLSTVYAMLGRARAQVTDAKENDRIDRERMAASGGLPGVADRRFELVKAAMISGRDGHTSVRDADEALAAMGEREAPTKVARGQASFLGLFDGNLTADKVRAVAGLLRAGTEKMVEDDDDVPGWLDEVMVRLCEVASWLRGEGAEPPGTT
jgi:hypothetical protein